MWTTRSGGRGPCCRYERFDVEAVKQLHRIVEGAALRHPEVEQLHGVRRPEVRSRPSFSLEPSHFVFQRTPRLVTGPVVANEFDRRGTRQQPMSSAPHLAHTALAEFFLETVTAELTRGGGFAPEAVDSPHANVCQRHGDGGTDHCADIRVNARMNQAIDLQNDQHDRRRCAGRDGGREHALGWSG